MSSKTNAMRLLDLGSIPYDILTYSTGDGKIDGISVAAKIGRNPDTVYKTLVTRGISGDYYVFLLPVERELDLKKAARAAEEKKIELLPVKEIRKATGYIRGGCSPLGMKREFPTFIDVSAAGLDRIIVSGGKVGLQIELKVRDLCRVTGASLEELTAD